ncbi:MAG: class I SAM-dependent methyltransferase [Nitrospirae bacterium]|nr:class I SAM-dependent methyltransferase [Nitrospirota bacterium]MBF0554097.1 class I SAM-dependent methyltransferase [Nitrospirota bacterium]
MHPLTSNLPLDDPQTTELRRTIIRDKFFLRRIYNQWYCFVASVVPSGDGAVLEVGSGAGFIKDIIPEAITSEAFPCTGVDMVLHAEALQFANSSLRTIIMIDVLHHVSRPCEFFSEAVRCLRPGGIIAMVEPWITPWSSFVYQKLHHEPFKPDATEWEFSSDGPLTGANIALPWIIFERDRMKFESEYPQLRIRSVQPIMPFLYLMSGGISFRSLMPEWSYGMWFNIERLLSSLMPKIAMFAYIIIDRLDT